MIVKHVIFLVADGEMLVLQQLMYEIMKWLDIPLWLLYIMHGPTLVEVVLSTS
jgi:hypothetical protein